MTDFLNQRLPFLGMMALAILLFAIANLPWNLDQYDQAKQAFTSFEMATQGHWLYQHTPNGLVATKPPLAGWIAAGLFESTHSWDLAWRLPSFVACLLLLLMIIWAARSYGREAVLIAACAFCFNLLTPRLATLVRTDMPLALVIFAVGKMILDKIRKQQTWSTKDRIALFVLLTAAMFIKGPIVCAFLLPGILVFEFRVRMTKEPVTAWCGWGPWLGSIGLFSTWVVGGIFLIPGFLDNVVMREFLGRFGGGVHQAQPFYFYLLHLLHRFAPWSLLLIWLPLFAVAKQKLGLRERLGAISPETFWLAAWSLGGLLVMSLVPSKRVDRIYPIVPPLCLLLAAQISALRTTEVWKGIVEKACVVAIIVSVLITTGYATGKTLIAYVHHTDALAEFGDAVRKEAIAHGWNYKVMGGQDEGLLLYLRQIEFIDVDHAVTEWNGAKLDGLVVPAEKVDEILPRLPGAKPSTIQQSSATSASTGHYVFLVKS